MPTYLITGVNRGIGYGWIHHLALSSPSNTVIGTVRNASDLSFLSPGLASAPNLHIFEADVTSLPSLKAAAEKISKIVGDNGIDVLINNAGYISKSTALIQPSQYLDKEEVLKKELDEAINVNVVGVLNVTNVFLPQLRKGSQRKVVITSSANGDFSHPNGFTFQSGIAPAVPYSISKAAVNMLAAKYAVELKPQGFVVLALSPGLVNVTGGSKSEEDNEKLKEKFGGNGRFKGWLEPEESVRMMLSVIERSTVEDSGRFLSHWGDGDWW